MLNGQISIPAFQLDGTAISMNARQLAKLGISKDCVPQAIQAVQAVAKHNRSIPKDQRIDVEQAIRDCAANPRSF